MPTLQVLQREADPQENQVLKSIQQMQENIRADRQSQAYLWQVKQMMKNADTEKDKLKYERKHNALKELLDLKKSGLGEEGFKKYIDVFGEDGMDAVHGLGEELAKAESPKDKLQSAQADILRDMAPARENALNAQSQSSVMNAQTAAQNAETQKARLQAYISEIDVAKQNAQTTEQRLALDQKRAEATIQLQNMQTQLLSQMGGVSSIPFGDMTEGGGGEVSMNPRGNLMTQANIGGITIANPQAQGQLEAAKTTAKNKADITSRPLNPEEQKTIGFADAVIRNTDDALSRIDSLKGNAFTGTMKRMAVDAQNPIAAGANVEPLQADINRLRNIIIYLRSGAQINDQEAARLSQLLQVTGKTNGQIKKDLLEFRADASRRLELIKGGAPSVQDSSYQKPSATNATQSGRFTIREKK